MFSYRFVSCEIASIEVTAKPATLKITGRSRIIYSIVYSKTLYDLNFLIIIRNKIGKIGSKYTPKSKLNLSA